MKNKTKKIRELFFGKHFFVLPGVADAFETKMVEACGFKVCHMSGGRVSPAFGYPNAGLLTMNEMVTNAHYIAEATDIPLLSDADTGYGNALNIIRTIREFIYAGVAAVHIEDQVSPKRCGHMPGKQLIELEEVVGKIRAAVDTRNEVDPDFVIVARTDTLGSADGTPDEALRRAEAYHEAGADVSWISGIKSVNELRYIVERVPKPFLLMPIGIPLEQRPSESELESMGVICMLYQNILPEFTTPLLWEFLHDVNARGQQALKEWKQWLERLPRKYPAAPSIFEIIGMPNVKALEEKYLPAEELDKYKKVN